MTEWVPATHGLPSVVCTPCWLKGARPGCRGFYKSGSSRSPRSSEVRPVISERVVEVETQTLVDKTPGLYRSSTPRDSPECIAPRLSLPLAPMYEQGRCRRCATPRRQVTAIPRHLHGEQAAAPRTAPLQAPHRPPPKSSTENNPQPPSSPSQPANSPTETIVTPHPHQPRLKPPIPPKNSIASIPPQTTPPHHPNQRISATQKKNLGMRAARFELARTMSIADSVI